MKISKKFIVLGLVVAMALSFSTAAFAATKTVTCGGASVNIVHNQTYRKASGSTNFASVTSKCTAAVRVSYRIKNVNTGAISDSSGSNAGTVSASYSYTVPSASYQVQTSSTYHSYTYNGHSGNCTY